MPLLLDPAARLAPACLAPTPPGSRLEQAGLVLRLLLDLLFGALHLLVFPIERSRARRQFREALLEDIP